MATARTVYTARRNGTRDWASEEGRHTWSRRRRSTTRTVDCVSGSMHSWCLHLWVTPFGGS